MSLDLNWFGSFMLTINTIFFYSFFFKWNIFFRWSESTYVACSMGVGLAISTQVVLNQAITPMASDWTYIFPIILGLMFLTRLSRSYFWVSRIPTAIMTGIGLGVAVVGQIGSAISANLRAMMVGFNQPVLLGAMGAMNSGVLNAIIGVLMFFGVAYYFLWWQKSRVGTGQSLKSWWVRWGRLAIMIVYATELGNRATGYGNLIYVRLWEVLQFFGLAPTTAAITALLQVPQTTAAITALLHAL